jgi:hypothetical protein
VAGVVSLLGLIYGAPVLYKEWSRLSSEGMTERTESAPLSRED